MHVLQALENLVDDVLFVDVFEDIGPDDGVQISVHEIEDQVDVAVVFSADHILQSDYVLVPGQLLQENNFTECALSIGGVLEGVKVFLEGNDLLGPLVNGLPDDAVGSLSCSKKHESPRVPSGYTHNRKKKTKFKFSNSASTRASFYPPINDGPYRVLTSRFNGQQRFS